MRPDWLKPGMLVHMYDGRASEVWRYVGDWPRGAYDGLRGYEPGALGAIEDLAGKRDGPCWAPYNETYRLEPEQEAAWRLMGAVPER